jgi:hypothetical protein
MSQYVHGVGMSNPPGRPSFGKTLTITERKIVTYLPSKELVEEWRESAEKAHLSLSRYIIEVVERYRRGEPEGFVPNWKLEEEKNALEAELQDLRSKYSITDLALKKVQNELSQVSAECEKIRLTAVDTDIVKRTIKILRAEPDRSIFIGDMLEKLGIADGDIQGIKKMRDANNFLLKTGLIVSDGLIGLRWKRGRAGKRPYAGTLSRKHSRQRHGGKA